MENWALRNNDGDLTALEERMEVVSPQELIAVLVLLLIERWTRPKA